MKFSEKAALTELNSRCFPHLFINYNKYKSYMNFKIKKNVHNNVLNIIDTNYCILSMYIDLARTE